jgi:2-hydroxy-3-keto-5-methylthiopentenyl-1-phosphate phosphatase
MEVIMEVRLKNESMKVEINAMLKEMESVCDIQECKDVYDEMVKKLSDKSEQESVQIFLESYKKVSPYIKEYYRKIEEKNIRIY